MDLYPDPPPRSRVHELGAMDRPALMARLDELSGADKVIQEAMRFWTVEMIINRIIDLERGSKT